MDFKKPVFQFNLIDLTGDEIVSDSQYGTAYLTPGNGLFNQYFAVILTCLSDRCLQFLCPAYLIHAKRGAGTGRLYEDRVRERLRFQVVPFL